MPQPTVRHFCRLDDTELTRTELSLHKVRHTDLVFRYGLVSHAPKSKYPRREVRAPLDEEECAGILQAIAPHFDPKTAHFCRLVALITAVQACAESGHKFTWQASLIIVERCF